MNKSTERKKMVQWISLFGVIGVVFYMIHVFVGASLYPGYSHISQAISDLTAEGAPSRSIAKLFSSLYGVFIIIGCIAMCIYYYKNSNKYFYLGILLFTLMEIVSGVGYLLFPLTKATNNTNNLEFQDKMHLVVTALVVLLTIVSLIFFVVGLIKEKKRGFAVFTIIILICLALDGMGTGIFPKKYLGIFERINIFSLQLFSIILCIYTFSNKKIRK